MSRARNHRASQNPSRPASKATAMRVIVCPALTASACHRFSNCNSARSSGSSFFSGCRSTPGTMPATSQLDWLISITVTSVVFWSKGRRDLLRSFGSDMGCTPSVRFSADGCLQHPRRHPIASSVTISFNLAPGFSLGQAVDAIKEVERDARLPASIVTGFQGAAAVFQESLKGQGILILAAIFATYVLLGILYESFVHPITIISGLPSAGVGALVTLLAF